MAGVKYVTSAPTLFVGNVYRTQALRARRPVTKNHFSGPMGFPSASIFTDACTVMVL